MNGSVLKLGKVGLAFLVLIIAGIGFIGGSAVFDSLANGNPPESAVTEAVSAQMPSAFRRFALMGLQSVQSGKVDSDRSMANAMFALKTPLYAQADFTANAVKLGDDAAAFSDALDRRNRLPSAQAPQVPATLPNQHSFAVAIPVGEQFSVQVIYHAEKSPRGWSLRECLEIWRGHRRWQISDVRWPGIPSELTALRTKQELPAGAVVIGEDSGTATLRQYVEQRRAFSTAVADQEWRLMERAATEAIRGEISRTLKPSVAFTLRSATITRPTGVRHSSSAPVRLEADLVIEQTVELFRENKEAAIQALPQPLADSFAQAQKSATEFLLEVGPLPEPGSAYYFSASPAHTTWTGRMSAEVRGPAERPVVENIAWSKAPDIPRPPLDVAQGAPKFAIFQSADATLRSQKHYVSEIETYIASVREATAKLERKWGGDREAWRLVSKAITAHGGRDALVRGSSYSAEVTGTRNRSDGKVFSFQGTRRVSLPFRWREDYSFKGNDLSIVQSQTLDGTGFWWVVNDKMPKEAVHLAVEFTNRRAESHALNLLWHLVADPTLTHVVSRVADSNPARLLVSAQGFPDTTMSFDPTSGCVSSVTYAKNSGPKPVSCEWRFADFKVFDGMTRSATIEQIINGAVVEKSTTAALRAAKFSREEFRNPYSPGKPFAGNPNAPARKIKFTGGIVGVVMICIDDDPAYVGLGHRAENTVTLPEGEHDLMIVGWIPQISLTEAIRVEAKPLHLRLDRDREINVYADKSGVGSLRWDVK